MDTKPAVFFPEILAAGFGEHGDDVLSNHGPLVFGKEAVFMQIKQNAPGVQELASQGEELHVLVFVELLTGESGVQRKAA